jgi:3',5'-cyclic AMP phosphodiesterase CpdA
MNDQPVVVGVFTDTHYSHQTDDGQRFFRSSLARTEKLVQCFQKEQVDFTVCLGDLIDYQEGEDTRSRLNEILAVWGKAPGPKYLCLGNHDLSALPKEELLQVLNLPARPGGGTGGGGSFDLGGVHFVMLDTNYDAQGRAYTAQTMRWDFCYLDQAQIDWLDRDLKQGEGPVIVFSHANLDPRFANGKLDPHVIKNHEKVHAVLESCGRVPLVLQGHYHPGRESAIKGITYLTMPAVADGKDKNGLILRCGARTPPQWKKLFGGNNLPREFARQVRG